MVRVPRFQNRPSGELAHELQQLGLVTEVRLDGLTEANQVQVLSAFHWMHYQFPKLLTYAPVLLTAVNSGKKHLGEYQPAEGSLPAQVIINTRYFPPGGRQGTVRNLFGRKVSRATIAESPWTTTVHELVHHGQFQLTDSGFERCLVCHREENISY